MMNTMINGMMNGGMALMMLGMFLGTTLWILLLAVLSWALITWLNRQWEKPAVQGELPTPKEPTAQERLSQRYAGREINEGIFQEMRERPGGTGSPRSLS
jgi:uncharacterized membrane protein